MAVRQIYVTEVIKELDLQPSLFNLTGKQFCLIFDVCKYVESPTTILPTTTTTTTVRTTTTNSPNSAISTMSRPNCKHFSMKLSQIVDGYQCMGSDKCIAMDQICDKKIDCPQFEDEGFHCYFMRDLQKIGNSYKWINN